MGRAWLTRQCHARPPLRALLAALLLASPAFAVPSGDYRAATGVTFVKPSSLGLGGYQASVQAIACPEDPFPPGGGCESLLSTSESDQEVDLQAEPDGCTPGVDCYEEDGAANPRTSPAADVTAEPDRNSIACTAILHPIEQWEHTIEYDEAADGYPIDEAYAFCRLTRAWQGLAGRTYQPWESILNSGWPTANLDLTMICGEQVEAWYADAPAPNPLPELTLSADTPCTLTLHTIGYVFVAPNAPERSQRLSLHARAGVNYWPPASPPEAEQPAGHCGLGPELVIVLAALLALREGTS